MPGFLRPCAIVISTCMLGACGETAKLTVEDGTGPTPQLPVPRKTLLPTVHIAPAKG